LRTYIGLALPIMLGVSLATLDEWYDRYFGALLATGTVATLGFARKLMLVPVAVVGQAIAAAALPTLARLWAAGRLEELDDTLLRTLRAALSLSIVAAAAVWVLALPLVDFVYLHGRFTAQDAEKVATLLAVMAFGVPGWITQQVAVRGFYAREEMWRPMLLGTGIAVAAVPLYLSLGRRHGALGLALAGAIAMSTNALLTLAWVRIRHGGPSLVAIAVSGARALPVAAAAAAAGWSAQQWVWEGAPSVLQLAIAGGAYACVAGAAVLAIGDDTLKALVRGALVRVGRVARRQ
jgi:putative peptidoglycan lipid II flippase